MPLNREDALRLLHFCLGPNCSGGVGFADDGAAIVTVAPADSRAGVAPVRTFQEATFDAALRQAADAGMLKAACVEKQIAFLSKEGTREARSTSTSGPLRPPPRDQFPRLVTAMSALLHEVQLERGMSAICAASSGRHFRRDLGRQRKSVDAKCDRLMAVRRALAGSLGTTLLRRFERVEAQLRAVHQARAALDASQIRPSELVATYSSTNLELLGSETVRWSPSLRDRSTLPHWLASCCCTPRRRRGSSALDWGLPSPRRHSLTRIGRRWRHCSRRVGATCISSLQRRRALPRALERALVRQVEADLARAEDLILAGREDETDLDARGWFNLRSRKIELLAEVGVATLRLIAGG